MYEKITDANVHPLPFCKTRWCENEQTAEGAAELWPKYCKFVEHLMTLPKSIQPKNNKGYDGLITVVTDALVEIQ